MSVSQIEHLKNSVAKSQIISFDLFDTLLVRPYSSPQDVFSHLELCFNQKGFAQSRIEAETRASIILNKKYVNYDEIYEFIPKQFLSLKEKEKKLELQTIYINPEIKTIFNYALKLGKRIIFTTDMYHSSKFISEILKKNNITGYEKIYISAYTQKSKHYEDIYAYIADDLGVKTRDILHIGDNIFADFENAKKSGCEAIYNEAPLMQFLKAYPKFQNFYEHDKNLTSSIILGLLVKKWLLNDKQIENYWDYFGYFYGGALCYGLSKFVYDEMIKEDLKEIIFVARDGYIIEKIFNLLQNRHNTNIKTFYIYANRAIWTLINLDSNETNEKSKKLDLIINHYKEQVQELKSLQNKSQVEKREWIMQNIHLLNAYKEQNRITYKKYLDSFDLKEKNIAVFDLATENFHSIKLLKNILEDRIFFTFCLSVFGNKYDKQFLYKSYTRKNYFWDYNLLEFIITAPELPIEGINTQGQFKKIENEFEQKRVQSYEKISKAEYNFSKDLLTTFGEFDVNFQIKPLIALIHLFIEKLDKDDSLYFSEIYHGVDEGHTSYIPLLSSIDTKKFSQRNLDQQGAINQVKAHLSYKLGSAMVEVKKNPLKALILPLILIYIFIKHKLIQLSTKFLLHINPSLRTLNLEDYCDYSEALQVKKHLSYRLGSALIKNPFTFIFKARRIYREWKEERK